MATSCRFRRSYGLEKTRHREGAADGDPRCAARHGRLLQHRRGQGRHRLQRQGDRGGRQETGRRNPPGRRRDLPHRLAQPDRQGRQALRQQANPGSASKARNISPAKAWSRSAPTPGRVEVLPFESKNLFEVHHILLPMNGTYILENMDTAELAKDKAYEFLFVLGPSPLQGRRAEHDQPGRDPLDPALWTAWRSRMDATPAIAPLRSTCWPACYAGHARPDPTPDRCRRALA